MRPIFLSVFLAASALAQNSPSPAFEVASVKINPDFSQSDRSTWLRKMDISPGSLTMRNVNLTMLASWAYGLQQPRISGPSWLDDRRYDVVAKAGKPADDDEMRLMLRSLLADRFKMTAHRETREVEVMALLLPKSGTHRMKESQVEGPTKNHQDPERGTVIEGAPLQGLCDDFSKEVGAPMIDMTGLKGRFDFSLNTRKYVEALRARVMSEGRPMSDEQARLLLVQDIIAGELGLRLESRKAPVELLVIDHVEKSPAEN